MRVLVVAGEASGDAHGAKVTRLLRRQGAEVDAVGGTALEDAGARLLTRIDELAVLGFVEVLGKLPRLLRLKADLERRLRGGRYDLFLPVDFPGLNLRLAQTAHRARVPVLYYVGPQIWAWRSKRLGALGRAASHVALILPFEKPIYDQAGIPATFVGHPLLDDPRHPPVEPDLDLGLFPGSRTQEVERHLPLLLATVRLLRAERPNLRCLVSRAPTVPAELVRQHVGDLGSMVEIVETPARQAMTRCRALLVASGTATLEAALAGRPFAVFYRTGRVNYALVRRLVHLSHVSLVNLVAEQEVVREYLQGDATPRRLAGESARLLDDPTEGERIRVGLDGVLRRLGTPGASGRVAELAQELVGRSRVVQSP